LSENQAFFERFGEAAKLPQETAISQANFCPRRRRGKWIADEVRET